jgi:hypothetical protein
LYVFYRIIIFTKPFTNTTLYYKILLESEPIPLVTKYFGDFIGGLKININYYEIYLYNHFLVKNKSL